MGKVVVTEEYLEDIADAIREKGVAGTFTPAQMGDGVRNIQQGGGGTTDYDQLSNKPQINGITLTGNKTTQDLNIVYGDIGGKPTLGTASAKDVPASGNASSSQVVMGNDTRLTDARPASDVQSWAKAQNKPTYTASEVGLGNVPNVATDDQTPTFTTASSRNNLVSGEKLSVMLGKISKFFNDLKTVAFSGSFTDLTNKPENANTFQGTIAEWNQLTTAEKKAYDHASIPDSLDGNVTFPASKVMMTGGGSVEDRLDANALDTRVNIISYTSTAYVCPSDGYVLITNYSGSDTGYATIAYDVDVGSTKGISIGGAVGRFSVFVKKGMAVKIVGTVAGAFFNPLT